MRRSIQLTPGRKNCQATEKLWSGTRVRARNSISARNARQLLNKCPRLVTAERAPLSDVTFCERPPVGRVSLGAAGSCHSLEHSVKAQPKPPAPIRAGILAMAFLFSRCLLNPLSSRFRRRCRRN
jgi:hypothetical protein